jgi:solute carrier family 4 anion exchanger 2/solute carrier family 4 anion exchanger 3
MKMHLSTLIQILFLAVILVLKSTESSLSFPVFLILLVPIRNLNARSIHYRYPM